MLGSERSEVCLFLLFILWGDRDSALWFCGFCFTFFNKGKLNNKLEWQGLELGDLQGRSQPRPFCDSMNSALLPQSKHHPDPFLVLLETAATNVVLVKV